MRKIFLVFSLAVCVLMLCLSISVCAKTYPDVRESSMSYKAVSVLSDMGVVAGYDDGYFKPEKNITRAEFTALLARTLGYNKNTYKPISALPFGDVTVDYWARGYISFCYEKKLINGMGDNKFAPADMVTYEQAVKMVVCAIGAESEAKQYAGGKWYTGYLEEASKKELLKNVTVEVSVAAKRIQIVQLVYNAIDGGYVKVSANASPDNTSEGTLSGTSKPQMSVIKKIVVDAGHNHDGVDIGAHDKTGEIFEQDITWAIADKVRQRLEKLGYTVIMTRETAETNVSNTSQLESLEKRVEIANSSSADLFISIHCNAGGGTGVETYCYKTGLYSEELAQYIQKEIVSETGLFDRGVKTANYYVIKNTLMPAVLVETGFIDTDSDLKIINSDKGQDLIATAIVNGIKTYASTPRKNAETDAQALEEA